MERKQDKGNKKNEQSKTKQQKLPIFLLTGILLICAILVIFYYIGIHYSPVNTIQYAGYGIEAKTLTKNLKSWKYRWKYETHKNRRTRNNI